MHSDPTRPVRASGYPRSPRGARIDIPAHWFVSPRVLELSPRAVIVHLGYLAWSAERGTSGVVRRRVVESIPVVNLSRCVRLRRVDELVDAGLWVDAEDGWQIVEFDRYTRGGLLPSDGEEETRWTRAVRATVEYRAARQAALERDEWRCRALIDGVLCGGGRDVGSWLEVHHITPISDGGAPADLDNLVTLCNVCHRANGHGALPFIKGGD